MSARVTTAFKTANQTIDWAHADIADLNSSIHRFMDGDVHEVVVEVDAKTGENVQKLRIRQGVEIDPDIARKATQALLNSRHSFDQAVYAAVTLTSGVPKDTIYFPWAGSPADLNQLLTRRGIDHRLWDVIANHQPYGTSDAYLGGDDTIRTLARIANDKHTVGLRFGANVSGNSVAMRFNKGKREDNVFIRIPRWDAEKNEVELMRWTGTPEMNGEQQVFLEIVFQDARLPHPVNVVTGLKAFASKAKAVAESLEARCNDLGF